MKVRYTEGPDALELADAGVIAERGEAVEVPDEVGERLLEQGFEEVGKSKGRKAEKEE